MIFQEPQMALSNAYPHRPARLIHQLKDNEFFTTERLLELTRELPPECVEYNAGDLPIQQDPAMTPVTGLSAQETIRRIADCGSWMVIKNIEKQPDYAALMERCFSEISGAADAAAGPMHRKEGFVFLSSPGAVTPFHMDPEHNILLQIRGEKTMHVYPSADYAMIPPQRHEAYHKNGHRNLDYRATFEKAATPYRLRPGDAIYVPVKAPHRVKNGDAVSISLSITWRSRLSDADARIHHVNHALRRFGARPARPGDAPHLDAAKVFAHRLVSRLTARKRA